MKKKTKKPGSRAPHVEHAALDKIVMEGSLELALPEDRAHLVVLSDIPADKHPALVYLGRLASGSRRTMRHALDTIARMMTDDRCDAITLDWTRMRYQHTAAVRTALAEKSPPATVNKSLSALRGVLKECWRLGYVEAEEYHRAADLSNVRGSSLPHGRAVSMGELRTLFEGCAQDKRPAGVRDAAMMGVLYGAGLRRSELVGLNFSDYNPATAEIRVRGKGRKVRMCYAPAGCVLALDRWIALRGQEHGPLFCHVNKGGRIIRRRMTDQAVLYVLQKRAKDFSVAHFSPHDLRRTFVGDLLDAGADVSSVQQLAGHANVQTTIRYDRRGEKTRRKAAELLHVPFTP